MIAIHSVRVVFFSICSLFLALSNVTLVHADSWTAPAQSRYESSNRRFVFVTLPSGIAFDAGGLKLSQHDMASVQSLGRDTARGFLCRVTADGSCEIVWRKVLKNRWSPVSALVADSGRLVVTFDEWGMAGHQNSVVVYGQGGAVVRAYELGDILRWDQLLRVPTSVSSRWWSGDYRHTFSADERELILNVRVSPFLSSDPPKYIIRKLKLPTN